MKIYINKVKENWVVDRFVKEWKIYNFETKNTYFDRNTIIWIIAPWTWKKIPKKFLVKRKVVCTIHHIDEDKFKENEFAEFNERDQYVDLYHVISDKTFDQVKKYTKKEIIKIPFWINSNLWFEIQNKNDLYKKYNLDKNSFYVGSFQRDTEGNDLISPKLSKGPDNFFKIAKYLNKNKNDLTVVLTGKRRQYLINKFDKEGINYKYFEMVNFEELNELYNILNLYIVTSRYEGGPQAILECALNKTPIISTDVGIASEILSKESIFDMHNFVKAIPNVDYAFKKVQKYIIPDGFTEFNNMFENIYED